MKLPDLHIHTIYSDGIDSPAEIIRESASKAISPIGFTDHFDEVIEYSSIQKYLETIERVKTNQNCVVLCGIEVDVPDRDSFLTEYKKNSKFDFVVFHDIKNLDEIDYLSELSNNIPIPLVLGHLDVRGLGGPDILVKKILPTKLIPEINQLHFNYLTKSESEEELSFFDVFRKHKRTISFGTDSTEAPTVGQYSEQLQTFAKKSIVFMGEKRKKIAGFVNDAVISSIGDSNETWSYFKHRTTRKPFPTSFNAVKEIGRQQNPELFSVFKTESLLHAKRKLLSKTAEPGEKRAALDIMKTLYYFPDLRAEIIFALKNASNDSFKHVRKWALETLSKLFAVDSAHQQEIRSIIESKLQDDRKSVINVTRKILDKLSLQPD